MDLQIICFTFPLIFSIFIIFSIAFFIYVIGRRKTLPDYNNAVPVIEISKVLQKVCPINTSNKWKLFPIGYGCHRCWSQSTSLPFLKKAIDLYGSSTILNCSSANVCSLIADVTKWPEWNPFYTSQYIVKSFHDKQLRRDHYMEAEQIIAIVRKTNKIQSHVFMYRFHNFSENKVGWILFWNPKRLEFLYFLIQPFKSKNENSLCLLTHIMGNDSNLSSSSVSLVSQRLRNIQDIVSFTSLCSVPSTTTSPVQSKSEDAATQNKSQPSNSNCAENNFSLSSVRAHKRDARSTVFLLVPFVSSLNDFWKRDVEFKLAVRNMDSVSSNMKPLHDSKENTSKSKVEYLPNHPLRRTTSDVGFKPNILPGVKQDTHTLSPSKKSSSSNSTVDSVLKENHVRNRRQSLDTTSEDSETKNNSGVKGRMFSRSNLRSFSETAVNTLGHDSNHKLQNINENSEDKLLAIDEMGNNEVFNSSISDFEIVENCEFTENRIAGFLTQGNYGAAELQTESLLASQYTDDMDAGHFQSVGGWTFHSNHKGLCVLSKITCNKFIKICSFLCQTEIPVAPKDVWKFVKNPQFRFICDESVKSVKVLEKISNSQKLIHTYHETGGIIRKELMDFCLLQTEREEMNKYYSCFYSIEYDKCPFMKSVTRGTLRPSGWIVEKIDKDVNKSLVTYMMQILVSSPDSIIIQELSTMVPQSVHNLKNYITSKPV